MANEFVAKNGLISQNNTTVSGSLTVTQGITGSFSGSVAGYVLTSQTSSFATTGSNTFIGNQIITGSLIVTGSTTVTGSITTTDNVNGATPTEIGYLNGVTSNIQTQLNSLADVSIEAYQALGSQVKAQTVGIGINNITQIFQLQATSATQVSRIILLPAYLQTSQTLSGVIWYHGALGVYVASNENKVGLYSYSGGTATLVASSSNDPNIWSGSYATVNSYVTKSFTTPVNASAGFYYIAVIMSFASCTTAPTFGTTANMASNAVGFRSLDFTNGAALAINRSTATSLPGSITVSGYGGVYQQYHWAGVY